MQAQTRAIPPGANRCNSAGRRPSAGRRAGSRPGGGTRSIGPAGRGRMSRRTARRAGEIAPPARPPRRSRSSQSFWRLAMSSRTCRTLWATAARSPGPSAAARVPSARIGRAQLFVHDALHIVAVAQAGEVAVEHRRGDALQPVVGPASSSDRAESSPRSRRHQALEILGRVAGHVVGGSSGTASICRPGYSYAAGPVRGHGRTTKWARGGGGARSHPILLDPPGPGKHDHRGRQTPAREPHRMPRDPPVGVHNHVRSAFSENNKATFPGNNTATAREPRVRPRFTVKAAPTRAPRCGLPSRRTAAAAIHRDERPARRRRLTCPFVPTPSHNIGVSYRVPLRADPRDRPRVRMGPRLQLEGLEARMVLASVGMVAGCRFGGRPAADRAGDRPLGGRPTAARVRHHSPGTHPPWGFNPQQLAEAMDSMPSASAGSPGTGPARPSRSLTPMTTPPWLIARPRLRLQRPGAVRPPIRPARPAELPQAD